MANYCLGIDVGGTNTDAVIINGKKEVLYSIKTPTTEDVTSGIKNSIMNILKLATDIHPKDIRYAMLGTTHCTNAIVQRKDLNEIAIIRIGAPATLSISPLTGIPEDLKEILGKYIYIIEGGHEYDGEIIIPLDVETLKRIGEELKGKVNSIAITSVFSPVNSEHEIEAEKILKDILGDAVHFSLSNEIGSVGLLERENATILNATITNIAKKTAQGFYDALESQKIIPDKMFFSQNDGTLMSLEYTMKYPILTIACGPTNSIRGAAYLGKIKDAITIDVGGTTSDIGVLINGFPRESSISAYIGGVKTNFRMPDVSSIGLGGGTVVHIDKLNNTYKIGPDSVGYLLTEKSKVFGGDILTITDIAVSLGVANIGNPDKVRDLDKKLMKQIYEDIVRMLEIEIDKIKTDSNDVPVILVGGGSELFPTKLKGASEIIKHPQGGAANAIGASIAQVSGQIDRVFSLIEKSREETLNAAKKMAIDEAIKAGAKIESIEIVSIEDVPLAYLPGNATKINIKAAGDLEMLLK